MRLISNITPKSYTIYTMRVLCYIPAIYFNWISEKCVKSVIFINPINFETTLFTLKPHCFYTIYITNNHFINS